ncbi:MAG: cation:proton antiporter [Cyanobacteriota/Melainabacteria group bacterium]
MFFGLWSSKVQRLYEDHLLQIALTIVVAYGTFIVAENMHVSAIIAVVTASVVFGHMARMEYVSPTTLYSTQVFWI